MLNITNLHKSYGKKEVLRALSLHFEQGMISGVVGKNGAGKTTFFRCIAGLEKYQGKISTTLGDINKITGFLDTNPFYLAKLTGREYLQLLCNGRKLKMPPISDINIFDLPLEQYAATYSTGMKKKLAMTGILLQQNEIFIFDEPFNGVDIESNLLMKAIFNKLKAAGKVVLISSHIFPVLEEICDKIYYLENGQINTIADEKIGFKAIEKQMTGTGIMAQLDSLITYIK